MPTAPKGVSLQIFAADWVVNLRTVTKWIAAGMPHRRAHDGRRTIVRAEGNRWKLERDVEAARDDEREKAGPSSAADQAELRKLQADANLKELELSRRRGELVPQADVIEELEQFIGGFAATAAGELGRFGRDIVAAGTPAAARKVTDEIHDALMRGAQRYADEVEALTEEVA